MEIRKRKKKKKSKPANLKVLETRKWVCRTKIQNQVESGVTSQIVQRKCRLEKLLF